MISVSAGFITAVTGTAILKPKLEIRWDGTNWTDETAYLDSFSISTRVEPPGSQALSEGGADDAGSFVLRNETRRFSSRDSGGDTSLRSYFTTGWGVSGLQFRLSVGAYVGAAYEYCRIYTGYIRDMPESGTTVTASVRDSFYALYQNRLNTPTLIGYRVDEAIDYLLSATAYYDLYTATLNTSPFVIPVVWLFDDAAGKEIYALAGSVSGRIWPNAYGNAVYNEASAWVGAASVASLAGPDIISGPPIVNPELLASEIIVGYAPREQGPLDILKVLDTVKIIQPNATISFDLRFDEPAYSTVNPEAITDYYIDNGAGMPMHDYISVSVAVSAQKAVVTITNTHDVYHAVVKFFSIRGRPLIGGPSEQLTDIIDEAPRFERVRSHTDDIYIQTKNQATYLLNLYKARYGKQTVKWQVSIPGLPYLEIGDRLSINDTVHTAYSAHILGITHTWTSSGLPYTQILDLLDRTCLAPNPDADYFVIGTGTLGTDLAWY